MTMFRMMKMKIGERSRPPTVGMKRLKNPMIGSVRSYTTRISGVRLGGGDQNIVVHERMIRMIKISQ
jgi:hypothetical protein